MGGVPLTRATLFVPRGLRRGSVPPSWLGAALGVRRFRIPRLTACGKRHGTSPVVRGNAKAACVRECEIALDIAWTWRL